MDLRVLNVAERVIGRSDSTHPADVGLRVELKARRFPPEAAAEASRVVFSYFRWRGWLDPAKPLREQIRAASALANQFERRPDSFSGSELMGRAVPSWIWEEIPRTAEFVRSLQTEPKLWLRARSGHGKALADRLGDCRVFGSGSLADTLEYCGRKDLFRTAEFHAGEFEVQDLSSQAVGLCCAPGPGETWWDACAGEGGKLLHLCDLMGNKGLIWATDRALWRLQRLKRRAARARAFNYRAALWSGGARLPTRTRFDGVLVDAPCSGTGTWQRNPHARWTLAPKDMAELAQIQLQLLTHAAAAVRPQGKLLYSVCSVSRAETLKVVEAFEQAEEDFTPLPLADPLRPQAPPEAGLQLWPQQFGGNGMFIAAWVRTGARSLASEF